MKYDIFISYRREGGYDVAKHLYDLLSRDGYKVSFDMDTLRNGDFDTQLLTRVEQCKDFILIVDEHTFDRTIDPSFNPNNDWLRQELVHALKYDKNIIPVFLPPITGFPANLPDDIAKVTLKNGPKYDRYYFNDFYNKLKTIFLQTKKPKKVGIMATVCLLALTAIVGFYFFGNSGEENSIAVVNMDNSIKETENLMQLEYIQQVLNGNEQYYDSINIENLITAKKSLINISSQELNAEQSANVEQKISSINSAFIVIRDHYKSLSEWYLENYLDSMSYDCNQKAEKINEYLN